jgi:hypothetical protein
MGTKPIPEALDPGTEVRGRAHPGFLTEVPQRRGQRHHRLDIAT